jgi:hypothetical protein
MNDGLCADSAIRDAIRVEVHRIFGVRTFVSSIAYSVAISVHTDRHGDRLEATLPIFQGPLNRRLEVLTICCIGGDSVAELKVDR